jgi:thioredoxin-like negative regulator of GroEL
LEGGSVEKWGLLRFLRDLAERVKRAEFLIATMERIVELTPDDFRTRFSLAYSHSEIGNNDLALHHYLRIPDSERGGETWNNLGVIFRAFQMPAKAVSAYRRSELMRRWQ